MELIDNNVNGFIKLDSMFSLKEVEMQFDNEITGISLSESTKFFNGSNTTIKNLIGNGLTKLILDGCSNIDWKLFKIPPFCNYLSLENCNLTSLNELPSNNTSVKTLNLSNNRLQNIQLSNYTSLLDLVITKNHLSSISSSLLPYGSIKSINASNNLLTEIHLKECSKLIWLKLDSNKLVDISKLQFPNFLLTLTMNHNNFGEISNELIEFPQCLINLEMNYCKIKKFNVNLNTNLMMLGLNNNKLKVESFNITFKQGTKLKFLDLSSNYFKSFNFDLLKEIQLSELNLADNLVSTVPDEMPDNILMAIIFKAE